jgi:hypothetical protein
MFINKNSREEKYDNELVQKKKTRVELDLFKAKGKKTN